MERAFELPACAVALALGLAAPLRADAQCTPTPYIVVDGQSCDWTASENPLVIPNNDTSDPAGTLDLLQTELTDNYNTASTGNGNLYGLMTFASGTSFQVTRGADPQVGLFLNISGGPPVDAACNANYAVTFTCTRNPCSTSSNWVATFYSNLSGNACQTAASGQNLTLGGPGQQAAFAINGSTIEWGLNFGAISGLPGGGGLPTTFLATPFSTTNQNGNPNLDVLGQVAYNATTVGPTAVTLGDLAARAEEGGVTLGWVTRSERGTLGFQIYRERAGRLERVDDRPLPGRWASFRDEAYRFRDGRGRPGDRYWIADIDQHTGTLRFHGPVVAEGGARLPEQGSSTRAALALATLPFRGEGGVRGPCASIAAPDTARLGVSAEGMVWVTDASLRAAGVAPPGQGSLLYQGSPWTSVREGQGTLFYAGPPQNGYDGVDGYLLGPGAGSVRPQPLVRPAPGQPLLPTVQGRLHAKQYLSYDWDAAGDDPYIWAWASNLFPPDPVTLDAPAAATALGGSGTLTANLLGGTFYAHHIQVVLNGTVLGDATWSGLAPATFVAALPPGLLQPSGNTLVVNAVFDTGAPLEFVMLESADLTYDRLPATVAGEARFSLPPGSCTEVTGLGAGARAWEVTDPSAAQPLAGLYVDAAGNAGLCSPGDGVPHRYDVFELSAAQAPTVRPAVGAWLRAASNAADELVIVHPSLASALQPLLTARRAQGLRVLTATPSEVDDAFANGDAGRAGLRALLSYARGSWAAAPRYLLLVGAANADPRDVLGTGLPDLIPTGAVIAGPDAMRAASDSWYAAGADGLTPTAAVGRLPADTPAQLATMVAKLLAADAQGPALGQALFVSDVPFYANDADFAMNSAVVAARLQAQGFAPSDVSSADAAPAGEIAAALASGVDLWHYVGHAGSSSWGGQSFLRSADVLAFTNARLPLLTSYDCLDGMFDNPTTVALGWAALAAPAGGAAAAFVPSTVLSPREAQAFDLLVSGSLAAPPSSGALLGDALLAAVQQAASQPALADFVRSYNLLGDPASKIPLH
ncbi:MAG: C25 family cysteine peptidase [Myxococcales bacterium]